VAVPGVTFLEKLLGDPFMVLVDDDAGTPHKVERSLRRDARRDKPSLKSANANPSGVR